jgi:hypothetical protein
MRSGRGVGIKLGLRGLPTHLHGHFGAEAVFVEKLFVVGAEFVDEFGDFDVVTAVFGNIQQAAGAEPLDGLEAFGRFFDAEGGGGDGIQGEAMVHGFLEFDEHIEGGRLAQVKDGITVEDFVIEAEVVEADDEIGAKQFGDELIDLLFAIDPVLAARRAVGHADAHAHVANIVPPADFVRGFLRFQVEIDNVFCCGKPVDHGLRLTERSRGMAMDFVGRYSHPSKPLLTIPVARSMWNERISDREERTFDHNGLRDQPGHHAGQLEARS